MGKCTNMIRTVDKNKVNMGVTVRVIRGPKWGTTFTVSCIDMNNAGYWDGLDRYKFCISDLEVVQDGDVLIKKDDPDERRINPLDVHMEGLAQRICEAQEGVSERKEDIVKCEMALGKIKSGDYLGGCHSYTENSKYLVHSLLILDDVEKELKKLVKAYRVCLAEQRK